MAARNWAPPDVRLRLFELTIACGGTIERRQVWAPSEKSAARVIRDNPSSFGLNEGVVVRRVEKRWEPEPTW